MPPARPSCAATARALELLDAAGGDPLRAVPRGGRGGADLAGRLDGHARGAADARDPRGPRLQIDAGPAPHRRRFGWDGGFWLPECAYVPGLEWLLGEREVSWFCVDQSAHEGRSTRCARSLTEAGPVALPIDWEAVCWLWSLDGYPSRPRPRPVRRQIAARDEDLEGRRRRL